MNITITDDARAYLERTGGKKLLIDMTPDMTNSGCGCGKSKKFYTPYIRVMKTGESVRNLMRYESGDITVFLSPKAQQASSEQVVIGLEKSLFIKKLELKGVSFIVE